MKKDNLDQLFENLKGEFDVEMPHLGHQERFLSRLNASEPKVVKSSPRFFMLWKPLLAVAATLAICFSLISILNQQPQASGLASVSPEMSKTQDFFISTIENELKKLNKARSPETQVLIDDALKQLKILETNYETLKKDLNESGDDQRVIYAMISNFQNRIDVLQNVMDRIDEVKLLKQMTL